MKVPEAARAFGLMILLATGTAVAGEPDRQQLAVAPSAAADHTREAGFYGEGGQDFDAWLLSEARAVVERLDREAEDGAAIATGPMAYQAFERQEPAEEAFPLRTYAGMGVGKVRLGMDIDKMEMRWTKDSQSDPTRVVLGLGYDVTESLSFGLEYKMLADDSPLFSVDLGGQRLPMNTRFTDHKVDLTLRYRFSL